MRKRRGTKFCKGKIKFFDSNKKHFGFIIPEKTTSDNLSGEIHFKQSALRDSSSAPRDGENIYCYVEKGRKGYFSNDVIRVGELTQEEKLRYTDLLFTKDLSLLIEDFYETKSEIYEDEINNICRASLTHYKQSDATIWRFLFDHASENEKALLKEYFNSLNINDQFKVGFHIDELLERAFEIQDKQSSRRGLLSIIPQLWMHDKLHFITDERWSKYLDGIRSDYKTLFQSLESGFKFEITLKKYAWSCRDMNQLLDDIGSGEFNVETNLLSQIFQQHAHSIIPDVKRKLIGSSSTLFHSLLDKIFSLPQIEQFNEEFTQIFINYLSEKDLQQSVQYLISVQELFKNKFNKQFEAFKISVFEDFRTHLIESFDKYGETQIIDVFDPLIELGLQDVAAEVLSRPGKIELYLKSGRFDLVLERDFKYLNELSFDAQRQFFIEMLKSVPLDGGNLFWSILDELRDDILSPQEKGYDPSTVFCMYLLLQIKGEKSLDNNPIDTTELFKYVFKKLTTPALIKHKLSTFFETCAGKAYVKYTNNETFDNEKKWKIDRTKHQPCNFCEGTQLFDHQTGEPIIDEISGEYKYWCRNSVCLQPSRQETTDELYFSDFLDLLGFFKTDVFIGYVNGWVNKINLYLEHLTCLECEQVLKPTDIGTGYYRVSYFRCENSECGYSDTVYLTHCINPKCYEVIDSRYTKKCSHGWYICPHCYGCCSTKKIEVRIKYHKLINKPYNGPTVGHKDLKEIFCPECSGSIISAKNKKAYTNQLEKFKQLGNDHPNIIKFGIRESDGKYWFLIKKSSRVSIEDFDKKVNQLVDIGFGLGSKYFTGSEVALISENLARSNRDLSCNDCGQKIDIDEMYKEGNFYRAKAIEKWHQKALN